MHTQHDAFDDVVGQGAIPIIHDQDITITEARLALDIGLTTRFAASLVVPVRLVSTSIVYRDGAGNPVQLVTPSTHHRDETLTGIADPMLLGGYSRAGLTVRAGLTLPLGHTEPDPFAMPDVPHEHIQFGTGTFNPVVALEAGHSWGPWRLSGFAFTQQVVYANRHGYHAGDRYAAGLGGRRALGAWSARAGLELQAESYERWNGKRYNDEGNQGRIDAMVALGGSWAISRSLSVDATLKIPFVTHVVGGQLDMPALLELGVAYTFGQAAGGHHHDDDDDDHDHEHGHDHDHGHDDGDHDEHAQPYVHPDTTGADVADVGHAGARVDLIPVPGKITIFDFWAEWCQPCKTLEPVLVELAKANPDGIALRRVDVVDWDSPVVAQYLTPHAYDLPHVKIYDAKGALVFEQSSGPGKLKGMIESIRRIAGGGTAPVASSVDPGTLPSQVTITITDRGVEPASVDVPHGVPVTLRFLRTSASTCATAISFEHDGVKVSRDLPLDQPVNVAVTFSQVGPITFSCAMDMIGGTINVR